MSIIMGPCVGPAKLSRIRQILKHNLNPNHLQLENMDWVTIYKTNTKKRREKPFISQSRIVEWEETLVPTHEAQFIVFPPQDCSSFLLLRFLQ